MNRSVSARRQFGRNPNRPDARLRLRAAMAGLVATIAVGAGSLVFADPVSASAGTWGAGQYPYNAGVVCTSGPTTSPLATYDFGSGYSPAALTTVVSSTGTTDSAALPYPSSGTQATAAVAPGTLGFSSPADIGTYAELLNLFGTSNAAEVAGVVLAKTSAAVPPDCVSGAGDAALLAQAAALAGPYTVTVSSSAANNSVSAGTPFTTTATVTGGSGQPIPGATVTFASTSAQLDSSTAITDSAGRALMRTTVSTSPAVRSASVSASVTMSAGLRLLTATGVPTATDPSGRIASAIYPAAPTTVTGNVALSVVNGANPVVSSSAGPAALAIGAAITPRASVTGMSGHTGIATFTIYGPLAPAAGTSCAALSVADWGSAPAANTSTSTVSGDETPSGSPFSTTAAGCYTVRTSVTTTNATPNATATSGYSAPITVIATTVHVTVDNAVVGEGPINAHVTIASSGGAAATITGTVLGPVVPAYTSHDGCASIDWAAAPRAVTIENAAAAGDGTYPITSSPTSAPGCYQLRASASLTVPGVGSVTVPFAGNSPDSSPSAGAIVMVLAPTLSAVLPVTSVISPASVSTKVRVQGTFGQSAHVSVDLMYLPMDPLGCDHADFTHATLLNAGATVAVGGDGSYDVATGATTKLGCYAPVEHLVLDSNQAVRASSVLAAQYTTFMAGVDPGAAAQLASVNIPTNTGNDHEQVIVTLIIFAILLLLCAIAVVVIGADARYRQQTPNDKYVGLGI